MGLSLSSSMFGLGLLLVALTAPKLIKEPKLPLPSLSTLAEIPEGKLSRGGSPSEGPYAPNTALRAATRVLEGEVHGSESVAVMEGGDLVLLDKYGYMRRAATASPGGAFRLKGSATYLGAGRPLGGHVTASGEMIICDSVKGLISVDLATSRISILANEVSPDSPLAPATRIAYANDLDIAADGAVFFSDSSDITPSQNRQGYWDTMRAFILTGLQGGATGRLLKYDPSTGRTHCLAEGIWYANGVALAADESLCSSWRLAGSLSAQRERFFSHWRRPGTTAPAGSVDTFVDWLPGFPDGVTRAADGGFWIAIAAPTLPLIDKALPHKWARFALAWLSEIYTPKPKVLGMVVKVDKDGVPLLSLQDPGGEVIPMVSAVTEHDGKLYLGNLAHSFVGVLDLADVSPAISSGTPEAP
eukprot:jgi/Tetstr1/444978/TSEL_003371.t1